MTDRRKASDVESKTAPIEAADPLGDIRRPSIADLRRAIIMNEILGPPISLRDSHDMV